MLYAKKDLYAMDGEVRRFIAPAGAAVPRIYEKLVTDSPDVSGEPGGPVVEGGAPVGATPDAGVDATAAAIKVAADNGLDLATVEGTGKNGRILESDVQALVDAGGSGD